MKKYAIEIVRGNDTCVLGTYDTKEQGCEVGKSYARALTGEIGVVALVYGEFDEQNKPLSNEKQIFEVWNIPKED